MLGSRTWAEAKRILDVALELPKEEREAYLEEACAGDERVRSEVRSLLEMESGVSDFLAEPPLAADVDASQTRVGAYFLEEELGRGGMGTVYRARREDADFDQTVAVKLLRRGLESGEVLRRFLAERRILAQLEHPNIARLIDGGETEGDRRPYLVMEYVDGQPITDYCRGCDLSLRQRIELFVQVCEAVQFAHRNLVVHRDLKPGNILVTSEGVPKLLDFGIAKLLSPDPQYQLTMTAHHRAPLTPAYASPEQVAAEPVTTASDVYSLGVLLYELLTGAPPLAGEKISAAERDRRILEEMPPKPSTRAASTPSAHAGDPSSPLNQRSWRKKLRGDLDNIVLTALRKEPERRFATVSDLAEDLRRYLAGLPVRSRPDTLTYRTRKFVRRNPWGVAAGLAALVTVLGFSLALMKSNHELQAQKVAAELEALRADAQSARYQQVLEMVSGFFTQADPREEKGEPTTVRELVIERTRELLGSEEMEPEDRAFFLNQFGGILRSAGDYELAEQALRQSLELRKELDSTTDQELAQSLVALSYLLVELGRQIEAIEVLEEAWELSRGELRASAGLNTSLGAFSRRSGRPAEAERLLNRGIDLYTQRGDDPLGLAAAFNNRGVLFMQTGRLEEAEADLRRSLSLRREADGEVSVYVANALNSLGSFLMDYRDPAHAVPVLRDALQMRQQVHPEAPVRWLSAQQNLGLALALVGEPTESVETLEAALETAERTLGVANANTQVIRKNFAYALERAGRSELCESVARQAWEMPVQQGDPFRDAEIGSILGGCLVDLGRHEEAEPLLREGYRIIRATPFKPQRVRQAAYERLAELLRDTGRGAQVSALPLPSETVS